MVTPQVINELEMYLGASFIYHFQWWDYELNKPQNLTNCKIDIAFRPAINFEIAFLRISTDDFIYIENPIEGLFTVHLPAELTKLIDYKKYKRAFFDCVVSKGDYAYNIMTGKINMHVLSTRPDSIIDCPPEPTDDDKLKPLDPIELPDCTVPDYATGINVPNIRVNGVDIGCRNCSSEYIEKLIKDGTISKDDLTKIAYYR